MSEPIHEDDAKFNELFVKQHSSMESINELLPEPENSIEGDDMKMDDLLLLQMVSSNEEIRHNSIEEKYEEELLVDEISKKFSSGEPIPTIVEQDIDGNVVFWIDGDPEDFIEEIPMDFEDYFEED